jgi:hypothetical protein
MGILEFGGIISIFVVAQCSLCLAAVRFLRVQRRAIEGLEAGEGKPRRLDGSSAWLAWVARAFPEGTASSEGWSRDDAFEMLDESVTAHQGYQWLQRLAVMAPLVGVLITAVGLTRLRIPDDAELTIANILTTITPLFWGVIVGASLAIVNQLLLQIVQWQLEGLRAVARSWFDREVWSRAIAVPRQAVESTIASLGELGRSIRETARVHQRNALRTRRATKAVVRASQAADKGFKGFGTGLAEFTSQVRALQEVTESTRILAESMEPSIRKASDALTATVDGFREAVTDRFVPAARDHSQAARFSREMSEKALAILGGIEETTRQLQEQGGQLVASTTGLGRSGDQLKHSIETMLVPAQVSLREAADTLREAVDSIPGLIETSSSAFSSTADQLRVTLEEDIAPSASLLHESIKQDLLPAIQQQKAFMQGSSEVSDGLKALFNQVRASSKSLEARYNRLADSANKQAMASEELHEALKQRLIPAQEAIASSVSDLAGTAEVLSHFLKEGIEPATARLAELAQIMAPMREAASVIGALGNLNDELRDLAGIVQRLREAVDSACALGELESIIGALSRSFAKADELQQTVSQMPDLFAHQINEMSNRALRRQADDLKETLSDIAKQFGWFAPDFNGTNGSHR